MSVYTVAHSPDADDIFMYYALEFGWITDKDIKFTNAALDIETLNEKAIEGKFDITAISFALYPKIKNEYALLKTAASFGKGYGPKLIKKKGRKLKKRFRVALSGRHTTNAMLFKIAYPDAKIVYMNFLDIENAVLQERVDAGVLIHESILNFDDSLECEKELWEVWVELAGKELPLPLGGMALRRSLPLTKAIRCEEMLTKAVEIANGKKSLISKMLVERGLVRISDEELEKYLNMYANEESAAMGPEQIEALNRLYKIGFEHGFYDCPINVKDYMIPSEYTKARFS